MKREILINNSIVEIDLHEHRGGSISFTLNGKLFNYNLKKKHGHILIIEASNNLYRAVVNCSQVEVAGIGAELSLLACVNSSESIVDDLKSPIPGKIVKIFHQDGSRVMIGDVILIVEAMKMEYPIKARKSGIIHIQYSEGSFVEKDAVLVVME